MDESDVIISSTEIIKDRLYFATLKTGYKPKPTRNSKYFHIEGEIVYENFYFDFGPYHLCHLYEFCNKLNDELARNPKKKVVFYSSATETLRLNAAYLIGCYQIIYLNGDPATIYNDLTSNSTWTLLKFRDASGGPPLFDISLLDVLKGVKIAFDAGFFDFEHFNPDEYKELEKVENGDLNWIVPDKMLAFSGPHHRSRLDRGYPLHSPEHYHKYFREHNVTTVVRLNKKSYDARQFSEHGFEHRELFFVDGSVPSDAIVARFLRIAEAAKGAVAVHCKAGLGRTGTLIACYMMKHHGFSARSAVAWLRVCRPGSVIGHQQWFLETIQQRMLDEGVEWRRRRGVPLPVFTRGIYSTLPRTEPVSNRPVVQVKETAKLDNADILNANQPDSENNVQPVMAKRRAGYMMATNSVRNANNTNLKPRPKTPYQAKTATFPPSPKANAKSSLLAQRANLARPTGYTHMASPLKTARKPTGTSLTSVTSTLSALTENCHLNGNRQPETTKTTTTTRKKIIVRSNSSSRKKLPKSNLPVKTDSNQDLSSSDTNITNISADSLETPFRFRRKRDKSTSPEPMDCLANSVITADVTPENYEESTNSQGNKLYKIKALRKKCPAFGMSLIKKEGVQTRASAGNAGSTVKKK